MKARVTLRDIADAGGVSSMTVSLALKNSPKLPLGTRTRIQALAKKLGYVPDPMLASLNVYRHARRRAKPGVSYHGTIAWVTNFSKRDGWAIPCYQLYHDGAAERLAEQGYRLEEFWLREPGLTGQRASQILFNRGVRGLLICPLPRGRGHLSLDWKKFSAISLGYSMTRPKLHLFTAAHYHAIITSVRNLRSLGYRRIGLVTSHEMEERMDRQWTAAFRSELTNLPESQSIPVFMHRIHGASAYKEGRELFQPWLRDYRPEVVVGTTIATAFWANDLGYRIPDDFGFVQTVLQEMEASSGIVESSRQIGQAAADFLVGMIQRGEYGIPHFPQKILIEGTWFQGKTIKVNGRPRTSR